MCDAEGGVSGECVDTHCFCFSAVVAPCHSCYLLNLDLQRKMLGHLWLDLYMCCHCAKQGLDDEQNFLFGCPFVRGLHLASPEDSTFHYLASAKAQHGQRSDIFQPQLTIFVYLQICNYLSLSASHICFLRGSSRSVCLRIAFEYHFGVISLFGPNYQQWEARLLFKQNSHQLHFVAHRIHLCLQASIPDQSQLAPHSRLYTT